MEEEITRLGLCFSSKQLYYAINDASTPGKVRHIGCFDVNFNVAHSIRTLDEDTFPAIYDLIKRLKKKYDIHHISMMTVSDHECWTMLPKLVYDDSSEREAHLKIIMKGINRQALETIWHDVSNREYKLLAIRNKLIMNGFEKLCENTGSVDFCSFFELGDRWVQYTKERSTFMMVHSVPGLISISAYILGKLRGTTYIHYDDADDLPYLWLYQAQHVKWMNGLYDHLYMFGHESEHIYQLLYPSLDPNAQVVYFSSLDEMGVLADEKTYGFHIASAFPAILLALTD